MNMSHIGTLKLATWELENPRSPHWLDFLEDDGGVSAMLPDNSTLKRQQNT